MRSMTPEERAEYLAEAAEWDVTLSDGLEDDPWEELGLLAGQVVWCELEPVDRPRAGWATPVRRHLLDGLQRRHRRSRDRGPVHDTRPRLGQSRPRSTGQTGLARPTFAITEQPRTISVDRVHGLAGHVDEDCLTEITRWVRVWLHSAA